MNENEHPDIAKRNRLLAVAWQEALEKLFDIEERFKRQDGSSHKALSLADESLAAIIAALRESVIYLFKDLDALKSRDRDEIISILTFWPTPLSFLDTEINRVRRRQTTALFAQNDASFIRGRHIEAFIAAALLTLNRLGIPQMEAAGSLTKLLEQHGFCYDPETLIRWMKRHRRIRLRDSYLFHRYLGYLRDTSSPAAGNRKDAVLRHVAQALTSIFTKARR
jgi:hypothetical protein